MKRATVRQFRHQFGTVLTWVEEGEPVEISKRGKTTALLSSPSVRAPVRAKKRPDFTARLKRIYGEKVLPGDVIVEERESRPY